SHAFFDRGMPLWRLAVPPTAPALALGPTLIEWGREQSHAFFDRGMPLWRLAVPPTAPALALGPTLIEWG
ncbi:hypothetical protein CKW47_21515, partial [Bordetella pertussis]